MMGGKQDAKKGVLEREQVALAVQQGKACGCDAVSSQEMESDQDMVHVFKYFYRIFYMFKYVKMLF